MKPVQEIEIDGDTIRLGQLLKLAGLASTGGASKQLLAVGLCVNGVPETRRGRQLHDGDLVQVAGRSVQVVAAGRREEATP